MRNETDLRKLYGELHREAYPSLQDLENESRAIAAQKEKEGRTMDYTVDAGEIFNMRATSPRDAANMATVKIGDRVQFPITVHEIATGESYQYFPASFRVEPNLPTTTPEKKKPNRALSAARRKESA